MMSTPRWAAILCGCLATWSTAQAHPGHATRAEVVWEAKPRSFEVSLKMRGVDLEEALTGSEDKRIDLTRTKDVSKRIQAYLEKRFLVRTADGNPVPLTWAGHKLESKDVWLYFEFRLPEKTVADHCRLENTLLLREHADQTNVVDLRFKEAQRVLQFDRHTTRHFIGEPRAPKPFTGKQSSFHGFDRFDFTFQGHACIVVVPRKVAEGRPWIWRARFFGVAPGVDKELLERGFHVAYIDVANLFGAPRAVERWDRFYDYLTHVHQLGSRPVLEGLSRGGLIIYNWAAANPEKVACLYGDAPVCDFKSWPLRHGRPDIWRKCLDAYGFSHEEALAFRGNPVDSLEPLATAKIPLIHVVGDEDKVVPVEENTGLIEARYRKLGGHIKVIHKPKVGHHPHGLEPSQPIVEFILKD